MSAGQKPCPPCLGSFWDCFRAVLGQFLVVFGGSLGTSCVAETPSLGGRRDIRTWGIVLEAPGGVIFERKFFFVFVVSYAAPGSGFLPSTQMSFGGGGEPYKGKVLVVQIWLARHLGAPRALGFVTSFCG